MKSRLAVCKFTNTESRMVATRDWGAVRRGRGTEGLAFNGFRVSVWDKKKVLEMVHSPEA